MHGVAWAARQGTDTDGGGWGHTMPGGNEEGNKSGSGTDDASGAWPGMAYQRQRSRSRGNFYVLTSYRIFVLILAPALDLCATILLLSGHYLHEPVTKSPLSLTASAHLSQQHTTPCQRLPGKLRGMVSKANGKGVPLPTPPSTLFPPPSRRGAAMGTALLLSFFATAGKTIIAVAAAPSRRWGRR